MRPFIALLLVSALFGCGDRSAQTHRAPVSRPHPNTPYPWTGQEWETDIVIDGPQSDQDAVRSFIYYLRRNDGLDPFGGTNDRYKGRVFWDADVWVFPALALIDPDLARRIPEFRAQTAQYAQILTCEALGGRYTQEAERMRTMGGNIVDSSLPMRIGWEVDATGDDPTDAPTGRQEHAGGAVVLGLRWASALGLAPEVSAQDVGRAVALWYVQRSTKRPDGLHEVRDVVSVDEWHEGDNCLYTNAIAEWVVREYADPEMRFKLPRNSRGELVAYEGDTEKAYQQAAAALILWPLEREDLVDDPIAFIERFEGKEAPTGPAMSKSVYALIRARYGDADTALDKWRDSWKTYTTKGLQFCEKAGREDLTYFNTGAAGCLNAVIYGFIGARIVDDASKDAAKIELEDGMWLVFRPNLPREWKRVTFKGMTVLGEKYDVVCEGRTATVVTK